MRSDPSSPGSGEDASFLAATWVTWGEMSSWLHIAIIEVALKLVDCEVGYQPRRATRQQKHN